MEGSRTLGAYQSGLARRHYLMHAQRFFKICFWLQLAALPFGTVLYIFFGMTAIASWESGSVYDALKTTFGVAAIFAATASTLVSPAYAARIARQQQSMKKERIIASLGSSLVLLPGGVAALASFTVDYIFSGVLWSLFCCFHLSTLWYVNTRGV